jgi:hypothetical protein
MAKCQRVQKFKYEAFTFQRERKTAELSSKYEAFASQKMAKPLFKYEVFIKKMPK